MDLICRIDHEAHPNIQMELVKMERKMNQVSQSSLNGFQWFLPVSILIL